MRSLPPQGTFAELGELWVITERYIYRSRHTSLVYVDIFIIQSFL